MAQLNIRLDSIKPGVIKKELFGTFIEYIQKRVNGKFGITAQEIEDRGFYALKMMNNHHGEDFVPVDYDGIRVSSQPNTKMAYFENMPMLDAVSTKSKDTLYIAIIN